ncbi:MAG: tetratricopeptide repeat protein [Bacteroidetes bacterium]|nr:MAG: tetratricopeptide repeat protein [Bacteroidota bacterium]
MGQKQSARATEAIQEKKAGIYDLILIVFLTTLPMVYTTSTLDPVLIPRQLYLSVFLLLLLSLVARDAFRNKQGIPLLLWKNPVVIAFALLLVVLAISSFGGLVPSESYHSLSRLGIELALLILLSYLIVSQKVRFESLQWGVFLMSSVVLVVALYDVLVLLENGDWDSESIYELRSVMAHKNLLSSFCLMSFPFAMIWIAEKNWKRFAGLFWGLILIVFVWLLQSRAVVISMMLFILAAMLLWLRFGNRQRASSRKGIWWLAGLVLFIAVSVLTYQNRSKFDRFFNADSAVERVEMWRNTGQMIAEYPVFGVGAGNWQVYFPKYGLGDFPNYQIQKGLTTFQRPHNDFLWFFAEGGIPSGLLYLAIFVGVLMLSFRLLRAEKDAEKRWVYLNLLAGLMAYLFIALVDFPKERVSHQVLLMLVFSVLLGNYLRSRIKDVSEDEGNRWMLFPLGGIVVFSLLVSVNRLGSEKHCQKMYEAHRNADWEMMIEEAEASESSFFRLDPTSVPLAWYRGVARFSQGKIERAKESFLEAKKWHPYNIHVLNNLASCYEKEGNHELAIKYYRQALAISPDFEEALLNLSASYFNGGQIQQALETIEHCHVYSIDPKYKVFLPAIVRANILRYLENHPGRSRSERLLAVTQKDDDLINLYWDYKKKNRTFEEYLESF